MRLTTGGFTGLGDPRSIIDVTRPREKRVSAQSSWVTTDGQSWWGRDSHTTSPAATTLRTACTSTVLLNKITLDSMMGTLLTHEKASCASRLRVSCAPTTALASPEARLLNLHQRHMQQLHRQLGGRRRQRRLHRHQRGVPQLALPASPSTPAAAVQPAGRAAAAAPSAPPPLAR